jgi:hypothetical protein
VAKRVEPEAPNDDIRDSIALLPERVDLESELRVWPRAKVLADEVTNAFDDGAHPNPQPR